MKKAFSILSVLVLITVMLVSCNAEQNVNDTVEVSFNVSSSRVLTVENENFEAVNSENLTWYYHGEKKTDTEFKTGQSASMNKQEAGYWTEISKGNLLSTTAKEFSQGQWYFEVKAIKNDGTDNATQMYYGKTNGNVLLTKEQRTISISVSPFVNGVMGTLKIDSVYIDPKNSEEIVSPNKLLVNGVEKTFTKAADGKSISFTELVDPGTYTVEVQRIGEVDTGVILASGSKTVVVYSGLTTTIKGSVEEDTTSGTFAPVVAPGTSYGTVTKEIGASDASVTLTVNNVTPSMVSGKNTTVTVPKEVLGDKTSATVSVAVKQASEASSDDSFTVSAGKAAAAAIDLTLTASNSTGSSTVPTFTSPVTVNTVVAKGLSDVTVTYNGTTNGISDVSYDSGSGALSFKTTHFSTFIVETSSVAVIGDTAYKTLSDAIDKASDGDTIVLLDNTSMTYTGGDSCISIGNKDITIDGNDKDINLSAETAVDKFGIYIKGSDSSKTVTIKNATINTTELERAIRTEGSIGVNIVDCTISTNGVGVHVKGSNKVDIINTQITVDVIDNSTFSAHLRTAVMVGGSNANVTVDGCTINAINKNKTESTLTWCKGLYAGKSAKKGVLTVTNTKVVADYSIAIDGTEDSVNPSQITINSGEYSGIIGSTGFSYKSLIINGGTFTGIENYNGFYGKDNSIAKLVISGGKFNVEPDSKFIVDGYCAVENEDNSFSIEKTALAYIDNFEFSEINGEATEVLFRDDFSGNRYYEKYCPHHTDTNPNETTHDGFVNSFVVEDGVAKIYGNSAWTNFSTGEMTSATADNIDVTKTYKLQYKVKIDPIYSRNITDVTNTLTFNYGSWGGEWTSDCLSFAKDSNGNLGIYDSAPSSIGTKITDIDADNFYTIETLFVPTVVGNQVTNITVTTSIITDTETKQINKFEISDLGDTFNGYCWDIYYPAN